MRDAVASLADYSKSAAFSLALVVGLGMGLGITIVMESKAALFPFKPASELCKAVKEIEAR